MALGAARGQTSPHGGPRLSSGIVPSEGARVGDLERAVRLDSERAGLRSGFTRYHVTGKYRYRLAAHAGQGRHALPLPERGGQASMKTRLIIAFQVVGLLL